MTKFHIFVLKLSKSLQFYDVGTDELPKTRARHRLSIAFTVTYEYNIQILNMIGFHPSKNS